MKYRVLWEAEAGARSPQLQLQLTPLSWGLAYGHSPTHMGLRLGPLAIAVTFSRPQWSAQVRKYKYPGRRV